MRDHTFSGTTRDVVLFGTGSGAVMARRYFAWDTRHRVRGHLVDREFLADNTLDGLAIVALDEAPKHFPPDQVLAFVPLGATGLNSVRRQKYEALKALGYDFISYVHGSNSIVGRCEIGENCFVLENQSVNFDAVIENNVVVWSGCQIGDRSCIRSHAFLASHVVLNGDVEIGEEAYLGSNCNVTNGVHVGRQSFIGANALISKHTADGAVHVVEGTPAQEIDSHRFLKLMRISL